MQSRANRGKSFEMFINYANYQYARKHIAVIEKQYVEMLPIRNASGKVVSCKIGEKSTVDYLGRYKQYPIAIEAKDTRSGSIRFDAVKEHQARFLDEFTNEVNTIGIVLVSFDLKSFFAIPWCFWSEAYKLRVQKGDKASQRSVKAFGIEWTIPRKMSVRAEELRPEWEVESRSGLDYLKNAEKFINKEKKAL